MAVNSASLALSRIKKKAQEILNPVARNVQQYIQQAPRQINSFVNQPFERIGAQARQINRQIPTNIPTFQRVKQAAPQVFNATRRSMPGISRVSNYFDQNIGKPISEGIIEGGRGSFNPIKTAGGAVKAGFGAFAATPQGVIFNKVVGPGMETFKANAPKYGISKEAAGLVIGMAAPMFHGQRKAPPKQVMKADDVKAVRDIYKRSVNKWMSGDKLNLRQMQKDEGVLDLILKHKYKTPIKDLKKLNPVQKAQSVWRIATEDYRQNPTLKVGLQSQPKGGTKAILEAEKAKQKPLKLKVYRGEGTKLPSSGLDAYGKGKYYSTDKQYASNYGKVMEKNIEFKNPLVLKNQKDLQAATDEMAMGEFRNLADYARSKGYDGIVDYPSVTVVDLAKKLPKQGSIEQIIESRGGWQPGARELFDTALFKKDKAALMKLLPKAPAEYKARFSNEINNILTGPDKTVAPVMKIGKDGKVLVKMKEVKTPLTAGSQVRTGQTQQIQGPPPPPTNQIRSYNDGIPPPDGSQDPVSKIIQAIRGAKPLRAKQEAMYSKARAQRVARVAGVGERIPGEAGFHAQLGQLKGELPKVQFESIRKQVTQKEVDSLFNIIEKTPMSPFEKVTAKGGLAKLLGAEGGAVPTKGELKLLNEVFPQEFTDAVLSQRTNMQKLFSLGENALNLPRSVMATADLSAPLRQGVFLIGRPKQWIPAFKEMFKYAFSEKAYDGLHANIRSRPTYQLMRQNKLAITDMSNQLSSREEAFMSNLAERAPIFGRIAKGSNRAYSGFLNKLRADVFDDLVSKAKLHGVDFQENPKAIQDIAKFVNSATGRGDLGALNRAAPVLNGIFFSPRLMASRFNLLNPVYYTKLDPFVRKEALKSLLTFAGTASTILGLSKLGGADVGVDPRSADFGKIKVGNTRWDPWGGFQQYMVLGSRLISGEMVSSTTGKEFKLGEGGYKPTTRMDIIQRFFESKEAPIASFVTSLLKGKTSIGEDVSLSVETIDRFIPMLWQDMYDLTKEWGPAGALLALPATFGVGSQTYQDQVPVESKTATGRPSIKWRAAPGLGEDILNRLTGKQVSTIPKDQWKPLVEERRTETLRNIDETKAKATVLETGEPQQVGEKIFYLKNGIVESRKASSSSFEIPEFTGDEAKDKKLRQKAYLDIGRRARDIKDLMEENLIDPYEAEQKLNELEDLKNKIKGFSPTSSKSTKKKAVGGRKSSRRGRGKAKIAKVKIPKFGKVKTAKVKVKVPKLKKLVASIKQPKEKKVRLAKVKKTKFKIKSFDKFA